METQILSRLDRKLRLVELDKDRAIKEIAKFNSLWGEIATRKLAYSSSMSSIKREIVDSKCSHGGGRSNVDLPLLVERLKYRNRMLAKIENRLADIETKKSELVDYALSRRNVISTLHEKREELQADTRNSLSLKQDEVLIESRVLAHFADSQSHRSVGGYDESGKNLDPTSAPLTVGESAQLLGSSLKVEPSDMLAPDDPGSRTTSLYQQLREHIQGLSSWDNLGGRGVTLQLRSHNGAISCVTLKDLGNRLLTIEISTSDKIEFSVISNRKFDIITSLGRAGYKVKNFLINGIPR